MSEFNGDYLNLPFKKGFFIGRFQHIHIGHEHIIDTALETCEQVLILVGSAQKGGHEERDQRNPFSANLRVSLIQQIYSAYGDRVIVDGLPDLTSEDDITDEWAHYLLDNAGSYFGGADQVDCMIYGNDEHRLGWFDFPSVKEKFKKVNQIIIARGEIDISATKLREYILEDNFAAWSQYVNPIIWNRFNEIRNAMVQSKAYEGEEDWL